MMDTIIEYAIKGYGIRANNNDQVVFTNKGNGSYFVLGNPTAAEREAIDNYNYGKLRTRFTY